MSSSPVAAHRHNSELGLHVQLFSVTIRVFLLFSQVNILVCPDFFFFENLEKLVFSIK